MNSKAILFLSAIAYSFISSPFAYAQKKEATARWFEIEVILFEQLVDKKALNEKFPINKPLPAYKKSFHLLESFIQPDITTLRQMLPSCDSESDLSHFSSFTNDINNSVLNDQLNDFSEQEIALVKQADNKFSTSQLLTYNQYPSFPNKQLCRISNEYFKSILTTAQFDNLRLNEVPVEALRGVINPMGDALDENSPFLINKDSLLLTDVSKKLRGSSAFKPLLHFGWRQIGITKRKAIPMKIIAGDNFQLAHQRALNKNIEVNIEHELTKLNEQKERLYLERDLLEREALAQVELQRDSVEKLNEPNALNENHTLSGTNSVNESELLTEQVSIEQQHINTILENISALDESNIEAIIETLDDPIFIDLNTEKVATNNITSMNNHELPAPIQPWFLDGFIKIHLDHYLYITADFNVINQSLSQSQRLNEHNEPIQEIKAINFSQDKRVISGEVHYFDHPYIGMIIQIRRFDPTKSPENAVSQAVR